MSKPRSKRKHNHSRNRQLTKAEQAALDAQMPEITAYINRVLSKAATRGIADGLAQAAEDIKQMPDFAAPEESDDRDFAPLEDYDAEEKAEEADEDRLAAAEDKEEAADEPDDDSPDYSKWSQDQQTEDEAMGTGVSPDSPDGWAGADLDPDWETGHDQDNDDK